MKLHEQRNDYGRVDVPTGWDEPRHWWLTAVYWAVSTVGQSRLRCSSPRGSALGLPRDWSMSPASVICEYRVADAGSRSSRRRPCWCALTSWRRCRCTPRDHGPQTLVECRCRRSSPGHWMVARFGVISHIKVAQFLQHWAANSWRRVSTDKLRSCILTLHLGAPDALPCSLDVDALAELYDTKLLAIADRFAPALTVTVRRMSCRQEGSSYCWAYSTSMSFTSTRHSGGPFDVPIVHFVSKKVRRTGVTVSTLNVVVPEFYGHRSMPSSVVAMRS